MIHAVNLFWVKFIENAAQTQWQLRMSSSLSRYSFSAPPKLELHVRPKLGEREVTLCHVTEWIEKKLQDEFQVKKKKRKFGEQNVEFCHHGCFNLFSHLLYLCSPESLCPAQHGWHLFTPDALGGGLPSSVAASVVSAPALSKLLGGIHRQNSSRVRPVPHWLKET